MTPEQRRARFAAVHLYLVGPLASNGRALTEIAAEAIAGGVDAIQLRDKTASDDELVAGLRALRPLCDRTGTLLLLNDRPDLAAAGGADGVHVGQDDVSVAEARAIVGDDRLIGLSTHSPVQVDAAVDAGVDHIGVGPINATPTKQGVAGVGVDLVRHAATGPLPFVAIGGIDRSNVAAPLRAGARRVAVVRAIVDAADPRAAAHELRAAVDAHRHGPS
jgi:thiamine-phosphate pyrophosphorylase